MDGDTDGTYGNGSVTHTDGGHTDTWWEVDLGNEQAIDRVVVWNRTDASSERLNHFRVRVLDRFRKVVFEQVVDKAPNPSTEIGRPAFRLETNSGPTSSRRLTLRLPLNSQPTIPSRFRLSFANDLVDIVPEEKYLRAMNFPDATARLTVAYAIDGAISDSAKLFIQFMDNAKGKGHLEPILRELIGYPAVLAEVVKLRPDNAQLQLAAEVSDGLAASQQKNIDEAVAAFDRALNRVELCGQRQEIIDQVKDFPAVLMALSTQRPQDLLLQMAQAVSRAELGKKALAENRVDEALPELAASFEIFTRLQADFPQPQWTLLEPIEMLSINGSTLTRQEDGSILVSGGDPWTDHYDLVMETDRQRIGAIQVELLTDPSLPFSGPGRNSVGISVLSWAIQVANRSQPAAFQPLALRDAAADYSMPRFPITTTFWNVTGEHGSAHQAYFELEKSLQSDSGFVFRISTLNSPGPWSDQTLGRFRLSVSGDSNAISLFRLHQELAAVDLQDLGVLVGKAHVRAGQDEEAAAAFSRAMDLVTDRNARMNLIEEVASYFGVLEKTAALKADDRRFMDALARHHAASGAAQLARDAALKARTLYESKLEAEPSNSQLANDLADLLLEVSLVESNGRNSTDAESALRSASQVTSPVARLGAAYHVLGEADKALATFIRAIELAPNDASKAVLAQQVAPFEDVFAQLLQQFPDDTWLRLGQAKYVATQQLAEGRFDDAIQLLSQSLETEPLDIDLLKRRADAFVKLKRWSAATADYTQILDLEQDATKRFNAERLLAEIQLRLGQFQPAAEAFRNVMFRSQGDYNSYRDACLSQLLAGNSEISKGIATRMIEEFAGTKNTDEAIWLVRLLTSQPGWITDQNSQPLMAAAKKAGGDWTEPLTAAIHYRLGNLKLAEPLLTTVRDDAQLQALAAMLLLDQGKRAAAQELLNRAGNWFEQERQQDPGSLIPAQQPWQDWTIRQTVFDQAKAKLSAP